MPSIEALALLLLAALPLMGSPGPATMSLAATGAAFGVRHGVPYLVGIIAGTTLALLLVASGVTGMVLALPGVAPFLVAAAAAYILYLAYRIATAPPLAVHAPAARRPALLGGLLLAAANPKAYAAIGAVYSSAAPLARPADLDAALKVAALTGVIVVVNTAWMLFGATLGGLLRRPRSARIINVAFAVLLVASVALTVLA
jgi:threonine/homoserine/homoserine lactone efflux protein